MTAKVKKSDKEVKYSTPSKKEVLSALRKITGSDSKSGGPFVFYWVSKLKNKLAVQILSAGLHQVQAPGSQGMQPPWDDKEKLVECQSCPIPNVP
ncbi:MAG: hypothetical protein COV70_00530 [Parcubacteria group bacterium CG11_big_fil_rev_8_21_14_0_20_39_22]|nr:MAG: hypothetical protein COV70_00530 [Parcubacteria group bacterium CG11_big_fil_rev_8_21_14_0_20_39_22]